MSFPEDFPPPTVPEGYRCRYAGKSTTYPGARHGAVQKRIVGTTWDSVALFYDTNRLTAMGGSHQNCIQFPSRTEMYNYIETMCALNLWEIQDE